MPPLTGTAGARPCRDFPASTMFDAKKPTYMAAATTTITSAPITPNCARLWIICGTPSCGPCAECSAMKTPPTSWPTRIASTLDQND